MNSYMNISIIGMRSKLHNLNGVNVLVVICLRSVINFCVFVLFFFFAGTFPIDTTKVSKNMLIHRNFIVLQFNCDEMTFCEKIDLVVYDDGILLLLFRLDYKFKDKNMTNSTRNSDTPV